MENMEKIEKQTGKIRKFSKIIYILAKIAFICCIVIGALELTAWIAVVGGGPAIFKWGNVTIALPIIVFSSTDAGIPLIKDLFAQMGGFDEIIRTFFTVIVLGLSMRLFKRLKEAGSPFRKEVVKEFKKLGIALIVVGLFTGVVGFLAAGIAWVLYLVFDYGCVLQNENDTTL